ncbi:methyltransferase family [Zalerion maritima]|uniref:carnosine N-methyltransferase n=1 Tax=Zalerion maritima TaxID=339359 RepID=A0AAD5WPM9_9PEZI|nr:methyltransferase family [Zalerion maritima]
MASLTPPAETKPGGGQQEQWQGLEDSIQDPEEMRVLCCALDSFLQYPKVAHFNSTHLRRQSFYALPRAHWELLAKPPFNYLDTLTAVDDAIDSNAELARAIVTSGLQSFHLSSLPTPPPATPSSGLPTLPEAWQGVARNSDVDKARSTIRQFYRDWSAAGAVERESCYGPVKEALDDERSSPRSGASKRGGQDDEEEEPFRVLVPGAGLGRLVFDLCASGYESEGNEISYHQLLASSYILNGTEGAGQHTIYPWVHSFSNHRTRANHLASCTVPDIHPATELKRRGPNAGSMSMCAADFLCLYSDGEHRDHYDAVASVFFLDTAPNLIRYLETIYSCLKPGGVLVNFGPLLWHFENNAPGNHGHDDDGDGVHDAKNSNGIADPGSFELTDEEVTALVEHMGFKIEERRTDIEAPYVIDPESMLKTVYKASFWVARKAGPGGQALGLVASTPSNAQKQ